MLASSDVLLLDRFKIIAKNKKYEFWQGDSLAIELYTPSVALQKLNYIHNNPLTERWNLAEDICDYKFSTAHFYESNETKFEFIKNLWDEF